MDCMDAQEERFIQKTLEILSREDPKVAEELAAHLNRVVGVSAMASTFPSLLSDDAVDGRAPAGLVDALCIVDAGMSSLNLPIRAVMGETFLTAKIQLFQAFREQLCRLGARAPEDLVARANEEVGQSIFTRLLGELLWDIVRHPDLPLELRQRAALQLVHLWESTDRLEIDDFFPVLEAAWKARNRITVNYGALVGVSEFFQLVKQDCPPLFVSYFTRDDVSDEETTAFQEFLFGLPKEELQRLRREMDERGLLSIDRKFAEVTLKLGNRGAVDEHSPEALYASYRRRQRASQLRRLSDMPGPRFTAEAFLVLFLLKDQEKFAAQRKREE